MLVDFNKVFHGKRDPAPKDCPCDKCDEPKYFVNNPYYQSNRCDECLEYKEWRIKMTNKIKAINPKVTVCGCAENPYYQIEYYDTADKRYHIGYGSRYYESVFRWLEEYFEPIEADEQPIVHGHWHKCVDIKRGSVYKCSVCYNDEFEGIRFKYCPNCGALMNENLN